MAASKKVKKKGTAGSEPKDSGVIEVPVQWFTPDSIVTRYATDMLVQQSEHEFTISFFELMKPVVLGTEAEKQKIFKELKFVRKECVARITIAPTRIEDFIKALQSSHNRFSASQKGSNK